MSKRGGNGTMGRFDFGESGHLDNIRRNTELPGMILSPYLRLCSRCQQRKQRFGGSLSAKGRLWICAGCRKTASKP